MVILLYTEKEELCINLRTSAGGFATLPHPDRVAGSGTPAIRLPAPRRLTPNTGQPVSHEVAKGQPSRLPLARPVRAWNDAPPNPTASPTVAPPKNGDWSWRELSRTLEFPQRRPRHESHATGKFVPVPTFRGARLSPLFGAQKLSLNQQTNA